MAALNCPRCDGGLSPTNFGEAPVQMCPTCMGTLVKQNRLITLMDDLTKDLVKEIDFDHPIEPAVTDPAPVVCPQCAGGMERFGYMETTLVYAWRCSKDWLVWADAEELGVMSVLYARTKHRRNTRERAIEEEAEALNDRVVLMIKHRFRTKMITGGLLG